MEKYCPECKEKTNVDKFESPSGIQLYCLVCGAVISGSHTPVLDYDEVMK